MGAYSRRPEFGSFVHLFADLVNNLEKFYDFFRITTEQNGISMWRGIDATVL